MKLFEIEKKLPKNEHNIHGELSIIFHIFFSNESF